MPGTIDADRAPATPPRALWVVVTYLGIVAIGTTAYWVVFFTLGSVQVRTDDVYLAFERAFPLADAWMTACALAGAVGLWARRSWGFLFGLLAGSAIIFLGCLDVLFSLNEGIYRTGGGAMVTEIAIEIVCLVGGPLVIAYLWAHRRALLTEG